MVMTRACRFESTFGHFSMLEIHVCYALNLRTHRLTGMLWHGFLDVLLLYSRIHSSLARHSLLVVTMVFFCSLHSSVDAIFRNFINDKFYENESSGFCLCACVCSEELNAVSDNFQDMWLVWQTNFCGRKISYFNNIVGFIIIKHTSTRNPAIQCWILSLFKK